MLTIVGFPWRSFLARGLHPSECAVNNAILIKKHAAVDEILAQFLHICVPAQK